MPNSTLTRFQQFAVQRCARELAASLSSGDSSLADTLLPEIESALVGAAESIVASCNDFLAEGECAPELAAGTAAYDMSQASAYSIDNDACAFGYPTYRS